MARLNIEIKDKILLEFKKLVLDEKGSLKGEMGKAIEAALVEYLDKRGRKGNCKAPIFALAF